MLNKIIALSLLSVSLTFASTITPKDYLTMSTIELEKQVEKLSLSGKLPFEMGLELIKRWSKV